MTRPSQEQQIVKGETTYIIRKWTPETACFWATRLLGDIVGGYRPGKPLKDNLPVMLREFTHMDKALFQQFQADCLSFVFVRFPSGVAPLLGIEGGYSVPDIAPPLVFELTIRSFMFSIADFFDPSVLNSLAGAVPDEIREQPTADEATGPGNFS